MKTEELIKQVKEKLEVKTDYAVAKKLDIPTQRISEYSRNKRAPDLYAIAKLAKVLKRDPWEMVKEVEAQTEKNPQKREFWKSAATILLTVSLTSIMTPTPSEAAPVLKHAPSHCILCQIEWVRRIKAAIKKAAFACGKLLNAPLLVHYVGH